ncbi:putative AdoMet-dependent methyltransferase [Pseudobutyrivibrio sp. YE44]|uniref:class I SAM-dependent methyltransferase n=1 Tax=Pseudobutyrivibrio sp. YE44 TaxID=1520802 RepID=UPI000880D292|nr:class I SAM-dependent methyltransferase [Pseudobutyrivibrio sp. YE44]SDB12825.1 putative AdoMet-dependent methyltransferase [Pseudobutyrivibrio sp. YE44]
MLDNKGFDLWADGYDAAVGISEEADSYPFAGYKEVLGGIFKEVMSKENAKVLDIGFGTGTLTTRLYENGCEVYGQDFSQRMIELAKEKMPNANLFQGDFSKGLVPELLAHKFDYIIGTYSLHHLTDEQKISFFTGLLAQLKEGGKLLIGDVTFNTRLELEKCKNEAGDAWDEDEIYFVVEELSQSFPQLEFQQKSYCSGIIKIGR